MNNSHDPLLIRGWRTARWGLLLAVLALGAVTTWLLPREGLDRPEGYGVGGARDHTAPTVGIGDRATPTDEARPAGDLDGLSRGVTTSGIVRGLETITGVRDRNQLVGQQVELQVPVEQVRDHHVAFWVGSPGDRVLVVMGRDTRDGVARQRGDPPDHTITEVHDADRIAIAGTIRRVPHAEAMFSWGLTRPEHAEVVNRGVYIEAHSVRPLDQVGDASPIEPGDQGTTLEPRANTAEPEDDRAGTAEPGDDRATAGEQGDDRATPVERRDERVEPAPE